jgi:hypothetical protein
MNSNLKTLETPVETQNSDAVFYGIAVALGMFCGVVHVGVRDPLLTALSVLMSTMFLGYMRPSRPWRWVLLVGLFVPAVMTGANLMGYYRDLSRAGLYGSVLIMLPGVAGAFGGHFGRRFIGVMFGK